jgi:hypothetical protein
MGIFGELKNWDFPDFCGIIYADYIGIIVFKGIL